MDVQLIVTVLTDDYIPPIILGEKESSQLVIVDGGQRTSALNLFKNGNYKITSSIENSLIPYKKKTWDENGKIKWEDAIFDLKNKTYEKLPVELKKKFKEYQIETVIHENCDNYTISKYIKRYNNHTSMNTNQKSYTYLYNFAEQVNEIIKRKFFLNNSAYTESEKIKGTLERIVAETVMCSYYSNEWKRQGKQICKYLNDNANSKDFEKLDNNLKRLELIITEDIKDIFNSKDSFIFLTLFDKFTSFGLNDMYFADFLREFKRKLRKTRTTDDGLLFDDIDRNTTTKAKSVIFSKLSLLYQLLLDFLNIDNKEITGSISTEVITEENQKECEFISENVNINIKNVQDDLDFYKETLDSLIEKTDKINPKLLEVQNQLSLLAMVAFSYKEDIDLEEWFEEYAPKNCEYNINQKENFSYMKEDLNRFILNTSKEKNKSV